MKTIKQNWAEYRDLMQGANVPPRVLEAMEIAFFVGSRMMVESLVETTEGDCDDAQAAAEVLAAEIEEYFGELLESVKESEKDE